jgi:hypothetical protein
MGALRLTLDMSQRWLFGKPKYRPSREIIRPADFEVAEIPDDTTARNFIREHHYSGSMGASRVRVGLYRARCAGRCRRLLASLLRRCSDAHFFCANGKRR